MSILPSIHTLHTNVTDRQTDGMAIAYSQRNVVRSLKTLTNTTDTVNINVFITNVSLRQHNCVIVPNIGMNTITLPSIARNYIFTRAPYFHRIPNLQFKFFNHISDGTLLLFLFFNCLVVHGHGCSCVYSSKAQSRTSINL